MGHQCCFKRQGFKRSCSRHQSSAFVTMWAVLQGSCFNIAHLHCTGELYGGPSSAEHREEGLRLPQLAGPRDLGQGVVSLTSNISTITNLCHASEKCVEVSLVIQGQARCQPQWGFHSVMVPLWGFHSVMVALSPHGASILFW